MQFRVGSDSGTATLFAVDIILKHRFSMLIGDSAIGKTYMCKAIAKYKDMLIKSENMHNIGNVDNSIFGDDVTRELLKHSLVINDKNSFEGIDKAKFVIIDNAEIILTESNSFEKIVSRAKNLEYMIIILHGYSTDFYPMCDIINMQVDTDSRCINVRGKL